MLATAAARTERRGLSVLSHRPGYALADSRTQYMLYMYETRRHPRTTDPQSTHMDA